jgi:hypothetical protein
MNFLSSCSVPYRYKTYIKKDGEGIRVQTERKVRQFPREITTSTRWIQNFVYVTYKEQHEK